MHLAVCGVLGPASHCSLTLVYVLLCVEYFVTIVQLKLSVNT